tara:strand:- start:139 stop:900 length:762 start_codon:yes stop_codon:yes gene_type:complete
MSILGTIGIGIVCAAAGYAAYQDDMRRRHIDANTPLGADRPLISKGWQYVIKQSGIRLLIGFGVIALLAVLFVVSHAGFWEALTSDETTYRNGSRQSEESTSDGEAAFRTSFRNSYVSSCENSALNGIRQRNPTDEQMERASVMVQNACSCAADKFNVRFSVSELVQYNLNPGNSPLVSQANQIIAECSGSLIQKNAEDPTTAIFDGQTIYVGPRPIMCHDAEGYQVPPAADNQHCLGDPRYPNERAISSTEK